MTEIHGLGQILQVARCISFRSWFPSIGKTANSWLAAAFTLPAETAWFNHKKRRPPLEDRR